MSKIEWENTYMLEKYPGVRFILAEEAEAKLKSWHEDKRRMDWLRDDVWLDRTEKGVYLRTEILSKEEYEFDVRRAIDMNIEQLEGEDK